MGNDVVLSIKDNHTIAMECDGVSEVYSLKIIPEATSTLVLREKANVLHQMDLNSVIQNLNNSVDLLDVAYHAVYGFDVQTQIWDLQKTLMDLNDEGINVIDDFSRKSATIIQSLISFFDWLTKGAETLAIQKLENFSVIAKGMSNQAVELANAYQSMANDTSKALKETMEENNRQYATQDSLQKEMSQFQSEQEAADIAQKSIKERLTRLKGEYEKLSKAELDAEKHQRTMDIVGAVFTFLGSAIDAASETNAKSPNTSDDPDKEKMEKAQKDADEAKSKVSTLKAEKEVLKTALEKEEDSEKKEKLRSEIREKDSEIEDAEKQSSKTSSILKNLGNAFSETSKQLSQPSSAQNTVQENRSKRLTEINAELIKLEEEQTKQLANLSKYTKRLEGMVVEKTSVEAAVRSLIVAISCLKNVVVAVMDIALFWTSMEKCCEALASSDLKDTIKGLQDIDKKERLEFYYSDSVMFPLLMYMVQWTAINSISNDYITAAIKTRKHLNETVTTADSSGMSREQHWEKASNTAAKVAKNLDKQVFASKAKTSALRG